MGLSFASLGVRTVQVFTVFSVLGSAEGERWQAGPRFSPHHDLTAISWYGVSFVIAPLCFRRNGHRFLLTIGLANESLKTLPCKRLGTRSHFSDFATNQEFEGSCV